MKLFYWLGLSCLCLGIGLLYFAIQHHWIMVQLPSFTSGMRTGLAGNQVGKKLTVTAWYYNRGVLSQEPMTILWYDYAPATVKALTQGWLNTIEEEGCMSKKIAIESVMPSVGDREINISFTRNLFDPEASILDKQLCIEGLLKTLRENHVPYAFVRLLVHHQPMQDTHIDLSFPWPITGFLTT